MNFCREQYHKYHIFKIFFYKNIYVIYLVYYIYIYIYIYIYKIYIYIYIYIYLENVIICNYSYKFILYIKLIIIKKSTIVFFCSDSTAYIPSVTIDHRIIGVYISCLFHPFYENVSTLLP